MGWGLGPRSSVGLGFVFGLGLVLLGLGLGLELGLGLRLTSAFPWTSDEERRLAGIASDNAGTKHPFK